MFIQILCISTGRWRCKQHFYFLLYTEEENIGFKKIFDFRFLMHLHVLRCLEHDLSICLPVCLNVSFQNIVDTVSQELISKNSLNFIFSCTFIQFRADQILAHISQRVRMLFEILILDFFNSVIQVKIACNGT